MLIHGLITLMVVIAIEAFLGAQTVKHLPTMRETRDRSLGQDDPLEKEMATQSIVLAWKIPWTEEPDSYGPWDRKEWTRLSDFTSLPFNSHWGLRDKPLSLGGNWSKFNRTLHYFPIHNKITPSVFQKTHYKVVSTLFAFLLSLCELHPPSKLYLMGFPGGSDSKKTCLQCRDLVSIPGLGRSPEGEHGNPLQYSYLENSHGQRSLAGYSPWVAKSQTWLSD